MNYWWCHIHEYSERVLAMKYVNEETFDLYIADKNVQKKIIRERQKTFIERTVSKKEMPETLDDGWYKSKELKTRFKLAKDKSRQEIFEDDVWAILSKMGFKYLSKDRSCRIRYDKKDGSSQQIDILAVDDETAIVVECKCSDSDVPKKATFKTQIESLGGKKPGLLREIRTIFGKPDLKIAFVLATKNYSLSKPDLERLQSFRVHHFSEADIEYYQELINHLGTSARFQFQADLFPGHEIPALDSRVYAIRGKMGGHTYYSFSIEPAKLLKIGYVLHRSKSIQLLPSYQRLIKKARLSKIRKFVDMGGFFPNSLLINIDSDGKDLVFEQATPSIEGSVTRHGVLHLPSKYRSVYIIDGQHRLYAYSDSQFSENNSIPVVAFVELERSEQLRLFMEINENQKAVSKNLKHTLDADLKWDSPNLRDRADGLKKQLAQELGDDVSSPLYNRVLVGEDKKTNIKIISLESILRGLNRTNFVGKFTKDQIKEHGIFNTGDSKKTLSVLKRLLFAYFDYFAENLPDEWSRSQKNGAVLTINDGVTALIMLLHDVIDHLVKQGVVKPLHTSPEDIIINVTSYVKALRSYFEKLTEVERTELRAKYGSGAPTWLWRTFQRNINELRNDFQPEGMEKFWIDQSKMFNLETFKKIQDIELLLRDEVKEALIQEHGKMWLKSGMNPDLYTDLITAAAKKNIKIENEEDEKKPWDCLNLIHYRKIMLWKGQWSNLFQKRFTVPGMEGGSKEVKTGWLEELNTIRNKTDHEYSVTKEEADFVGAIYDWLILDNTEKIKLIKAT